MFKAEKTPAHGDTNYGDGFDYKGYVPDVVDVRMAAESESEN